MLSGATENIFGILSENISLNVFVIIGIAALWYLKSSRFKGSLGEFRVGSALRKRLNDSDYLVLNALTLPTSGGTTQIDHVILSRFGVFVIETKNMQGWIFGNPRQPKWTQVIYGNKTQFQNPLHQNYKHLKAVQEILATHGDQIHSIVAFPGSSTPKTPMPSNVVWGLASLVEQVSSKRIAFFEEHEIGKMAELLTNASLGNSRETRRKHIRHVKTQIAQRRSFADGCPRCGADLVKRSNRRTGASFLGCSRYPQCKGTRK